MYELLLYVKYYNPERYSLRMFCQSLVVMYVPGIVLSRTKPINPPTNMLVLNNTVRIWLIMSLPTNKQALVYILQIISDFTIISFRYFDDILLYTNNNQTKITSKVLSKRQFQNWLRIHCRNLRSALKFSLYIQKQNVEIVVKIFAYSMAVIWNCFHHAVNAPSIKTIKLLYLKIVYS